MAADYWLRRALANERLAHRTATATAIELKKVYVRQYKKIYREMEGLYGQLSWETPITRTQLWDYTRWKSMEKELRGFATEMPKISVDAITKSLDKVFEEVIGANVQQFTSPEAFRVAGDAAGVVNTAWSGECFSSRIWKNTNTIANRIRSDMEDFVVSGRSLSDVKIKLMQDFSVGYNDASRLVETEASYVMNEAAKQEYKSENIKKVRWSIRPEDGKECELCRSRANLVWRIDNAPTIPAHPRCRCTWVAVYELPGEHIPCTGEGEDPRNLKRIELPEELKNADIVQITHTTNDAAAKDTPTPTTQTTKHEKTVEEKTGGRIREIPTVRNKK